jgi:hypothetical protein
MTTTKPSTFNRQQGSVVRETGAIATPERTRTIERRLGDKVWVVVRDTGARLSRRRRHPLPNGTIDTGGTFVTLLNAGSLRTISDIPRRFRRDGDFAPTHQIHVEGFHREGRGDRTRNTRLRIPLSVRATGPFEREVFDYVLEGGTFLGPAYPYNRDGRELISDTQLCVSGGVEDGEDPHDTARREVQEEIGFTPRRLTFVRIHTDRHGRTHHLFYADV